MGIWEELAEEFGLGEDSVEARLAADLAHADEQFLIQLADLRRAAGLTQEDLGRAWGRHKTAVSQFERPGADPRLSTIRRYAASIGARYEHWVYLDRAIHRTLKTASPNELFQKWEYVDSSTLHELVGPSEMTGPIPVFTDWKKQIQEVVRDNRAHVSVHVDSKPGRHRAGRN
jgi:transcriptional regulator with XRE-family HTH domain